MTQGNWYSQKQWETKETELERSKFQHFRLPVLHWMSLFMQSAPVKCKFLPKKGYSFLKAAFSTPQCSAQGQPQKMTFKSVFSKSTLKKKES